MILMPCELSCNTFAKWPYPPCLRMADRAFLAGYPRYHNDDDEKMDKPFSVFLFGRISWSTVTSLTPPLAHDYTLFLFISRGLKCRTADGRFAR